MAFAITPLSADAERFHKSGRAFLQEHGPVATLADGPAEFIAAVRQALDEPVSSPSVERRIAVARANDWQKRLEDMSALIARV